MAFSVNSDCPVLWGSYGSFDPDASWKCYFEDEAKYERCEKPRKLANPNGTFEIYL
jgi:hypothetical protein